MAVGEKSKSSVKTDTKKAINEKPVKMAKKVAQKREQAQVDGNLSVSESDNQSDYSSPRQAKEKESRVELSASDSTTDTMSKSDMECSTSSESIRHGEKGTVDEKESESEDSEDNSVADESYRDHTSKSNTVAESSTTVSDHSDKSEYEEESEEISPYVSLSKGDENDSDAEKKYSISSEEPPVVETKQSIENNVGAVGGKQSDNRKKTEAASTSTGGTTKSSGKKSDSRFEVMKRKHRFFGISTGWSHIYASYDAKVLKLYKKKDDPNPMSVIEVPKAYVKRDKKDALCFQIGSKKIKLRGPQIAALTETLIGDSLSTIMASQTLPSSKSETETSHPSKNTEKMETAAVAAHSPPEKEKSVSSTHSEDKTVSESETRTFTESESAKTGSSEAESSGTFASDDQAASSESHNSEDETTFSSIKSGNSPSVTSEDSSEESIGSVPR